MAVIRSMSFLLLAVILLSNLSSLVSANPQGYDRYVYDPRHQSAGPTSSSYDRRYNNPSPSSWNYPTIYRGDDDNNVRKNEYNCPGDVFYTWASGCSFGNNNTDVLLVGKIITTPNIGVCAASCLATAWCKTFTYVIKSEIFPPNSCNLFMYAGNPLAVPDVADSSVEETQCGFIGLALPGPQQPANSSTPSDFLWTSVAVPPTGDRNNLISSSTYSYRYNRHQEVSKGTAYAWANDCDY